MTVNLVGRGFEICAGMTFPDGVKRGDTFAIFDAEWKITKVDKEKEELWATPK